MPGGLTSTAASTAWPLTSQDNHRWMYFTLLACMQNLVYQGTSNDIQLLIVGTRDAADCDNSQHASKHVDKCNLLPTNLFTRNIVWEFVTIPSMPPLKFTKVSDKSNFESFPCRSANQNLKSPNC